MRDLFSLGKSLSLRKVSHGGHRRSSIFNTCCRVSLDQTAKGRVWLSISVVCIDSLAVSLRRWVGLVGVVGFHLDLRNSQRRLALSLASPHFYGEYHVVSRSMIMQRKCMKAKSKTFSREEAKGRHSVVSSESRGRDKLCYRGNTQGFSLESKSQLSIMAPNLKVLIIGAGMGIPEVTPSPRGRKRLTAISWYQALRACPWLTD